VAQIQTESKIKMKNNILEKAISLAYQNIDKKYSLCAIITNRKGIILSIGFNSFTKSSPLQKSLASKYGNKDKIYNHAEIDCLKKLPYNCKPYAIYIARVNKKGGSLLAKPCRICSMAIKEAGIKKIFHT